MKRQISLEEISDGRLYQSHELVKAGCHDCKDCSLCCEGMGESIILDPKDIYELTRHLSCDFETLLQDQLELHVVDGLILPNIQMTKDKDCCGFLSEEKRCSIHAVRPGFCRLFPLGRIYEGDTFSYFLQIHECPKENKTKVKVKNWIGIEPIREYENFVREWHNLMKQAQSVMEEKDQSELTKQINLLFLQVFFVNPYQKEEDFYPQFAIRKAQVQELLGTF